MRDSVWIRPAIGLTVALAASALLLLPRHDGAPGVLALILLWMMAAVGVALALSLPAILRMMSAGTERPLSVCLHRLRRDRSRIAMTAALVVLAGLNMIAFLLAKPLLNYYVPFSADPFLAGVDARIFGQDPARLLTWLDQPLLALFYHRAWFAFLLAALLVVLWQRPSPRKSATMLTYFLLWSVAGPLVHVLLPAGGPMFYANLGFGDRFAGLFNEQQTRDLADYLWLEFSTNGFGAGAGISAMPSLHIATTAWAVLAVYLFARAWAVLAVAVGILIALLSVSLGWHYAIDGIVGLGLALGTYAAALRYYSRAPGPFPENTGAGMVKPLSEA